MKKIPKVILIVIMFSVILLGGNGCDWLFEEEDFWGEDVPSSEDDSSEYNYIIVWVYIRVHVDVVFVYIQTC